MYALALLFYQASVADALAQHSLVRVPATALTADSLAHYIYAADDPDPAKDRYGIGYSRKFGWLKVSDKMNTDSFWQWTRKYCTDRVGEAFFYRHFRMDRRSLHDDLASEVYEVRYYFFPFDTAAAFLTFDTVSYAPVVFKRFDFLGMHEVEIPVNLPDCRADQQACTFPFDRAAVRRIAAQKDLKNKPGTSPRIELQPDLKWSVHINENDWVFYNFTVDSRTGEVSEVQTIRRID
jgi:hypothetical protein